MSRRTLLVAEPDELQRQLIDVMLGADFDLTLVEDGPAALAYLREHTPDAMLLATDLADVDGYTVCRKAKSVSRLEQVKVVLVADTPTTGGLGEKVRSLARSAGADLLLPRPLGDKNLRERLERLLVARLTDDGMTPRAVFNSGVLEPVHGEFGVPHPGGMVSGGTPATELGKLRALTAALREENDSLKARLAKSKELNRSLQEQLDELRKKRGGLFGRRG